MELITQELEKLLCYTMEKDVIEATDVEAICANQINGKIFDMVDAIGRKEQKKALDLYYDLLMLKESAMRILYLVTRHFQILMQLRDMTGKGFDNKQMAAKAGCPGICCTQIPWTGKKFFTDSIRGDRTCQRTDR